MMTLHEDMVNFPVHEDEKEKTFRVNEKKVRLTFGSTRLIFSCIRRSDRASCA